MKNNGTHVMQEKDFRSIEDLELMIGGQHHSVHWIHPCARMLLKRPMKKR